MDDIFFGPDDANANANAVPVPLAAPVGASGLTAQAEVFTAARQQLVRAWAPFRGAWPALPDSPSLSAPSEDTVTEARLAAALSWDGDLAAPIGTPSEPTATRAADSVAAPGSPTLAPAPAPPAPVSHLCAGAAKARPKFRARKHCAVHSYPRLVGSAAADGPLRALVARVYGCDVVDEHRVRLVEGYAFFRLYRVSHAKFAAEVLGAPTARTSIEYVRRKFEQHAGYAAAFEAMCAEAGLVLPADSA